MKIKTFLRLITFPCDANVVTLLIQAKSSHSMPFPSVHYFVKAMSRDKRHFFSVLGLLNTRNSRLRAYVGISMNLHRRAFHNNIDLSY